MKRIAAVLLAALACPALVSSSLSQGALAQAPTQTERVETPEGTVTIVRPPPRAQPTTPAPYVNPDPVPPPPATPFPTDDDARRAPPYPGPYTAPYGTPYAPYVVLNPPPVVIIQRRAVPAQSSVPRRFDDVGPVPPFESPPGSRFQPRTQPGGTLQPRQGFGQPLPSPRYPPNQYGPGAVPGTVPLPDAADVIILRR